MKQTQDAKAKAALNFSPRKAALFCYGLALFMLALDQISKWLVFHHLPFGIPQPALPPWLYFTHVHNDGAAFSLLRGKKWVLTLIAFGVAFWVINYERHLKFRHPLHLAGLGFILAGALGNVVDRLRLGFVVDFMDLHHGGRNIWPIFNVADICINLGVISLLLYFWLFPEPERKAAQDADPESQEEDERIAEDASITQT